MKTEQYQAKLSTDEHWLNIPENMVESLRRQGWLIRELVDKADKILADSMAVIDAARARRALRDGYAGPERRTHAQALETTHPKHHFTKEPS